MAICNLISKLTNHSGTFITLSQYIEDLNKSATQGSVYRVVPTKYLALDLDFSNIGGESEDIDLNEYIPELIQNYYENSCAFLRTKQEYAWDPDDARNIFWDFLISKKFITISSDGKFIQENKFYGNIDIQSFNQHDGMGYNEIYCYISESDELCSPTIDVKDIGKNTFQYDREYVMGYDKDDYDEEVMCDIAIPEGTVYGTNSEYNISGIYYSEPSQKATFNTIIVLYDIYINSDSGELVNQFSDIPMGIYFSGTIDNSSKTMSNSITKYISNQDIYGSGTAYGLRICSRFSVVPQSITGNTTNITEIDGSDNYAALCYVTSQVSEVLNKVNQMTTGNISGLTQFKQFYNSFKNEQVNVPYIKEVDGVPYWFINGKQTNTIAGGTWSDISVDSELNAYSENPVQNKIITNTLNNIINQLTTITNTLTKLDDKVFPYSLEMSGGGLFKLGTSKDITITWSLKKGDDTIFPDTANINGSDIPLNGQVVYQGVNSTTKYTLTVVKNDNTLTQSVTAEFILPKYFGFSSNSTITDSSMITNLNEQTLSRVASGEYTLTNPTTGYYLWLCVPSSMTINDVTSNGFSIPIETPQEVEVENGVYKCYRSSSSINSGEITFNIN